MALRRVCHNTRMSKPSPSSAPSSRRYWLMKNEPETESIDHALAAPHATLAWAGVRNYQARNFMRDQMQVGDGVLYWHSGCAVPGIYGVARIASAARVDPTQFDAASPYYDPRVSADKPRWLLVDVQALYKTLPVDMAALRADPALAGMQVLQKGNRLSITEVTPAQWEHLHATLLQSVDAAG